MAATYTPIASITLNADTSTVTFSSIPQTYTDLILIAHARSSRTGNVGDALFARANNDSAANYSTTYLYGDGTTAGSSRITSLTGFYARIGAVNTTSNIFSPVIMNINNYSNTTTFKSVISKNESTSEEVNLCASLWRSTSAISSLVLVAANGNLVSGSTFNLYGILGANA